MIKGTDIAGAQIGLWRYILASISRIYIPKGAIVNLVCLAILEKNSKSNTLKKKV
jgi:hypothetical protein